MQYVALLRGINVGGKNIIKMASLAEMFTSLGYENVKTFINSGNVIFSTDQDEAHGILSTLQRALLKTFNYSGRVVLVEFDQLQKIINEVPSAWKSDTDLRCYIAFLSASVSMDEVLSVIELREGVDTLKKGEHVLYMSTKLSGITKSGFTKLIGKKIFQEMTIRNYTTSQKLLALMEK